MDRGRKVVDIKYCFPCRHEGSYDYVSMKYFVEERLICETHKAMFDKMTPPKEEPRPYVLTPKVWVPKPVEAKKDFHEREPNDGELME
jgi:hypothetical protein